MTVSNSNQTLSNDKDLENISNKNIEDIKEFIASNLEFAVFINSFISSIFLLLIFSNSLSVDKIWLLIETVILKLKLEISYYS